MRLGLTGFACLSLVFATGCEIGVKTFAGTIIQMSISGATPLPADQHIELWARTANDDVVRISGIYEGLLDPFAPAGAIQADGQPNRRRVQFPVTERSAPGLPPYSYSSDPRGFMIKPVITMADPCMIDSKGRLLTKAEAYEPKVVNGVEQSAEEQAAQVRTRISQLTTPMNCDNPPPPTPRHCGRQAFDLFGVMSYSTTQPPNLPYDAPPADRLRFCEEYWKDPLAYTPNPFQVTAPIHGPIWGYISFTTIPPAAPAQGFDSTRIDSPINLRGIKELFATVETLDAADLAADPPRPDGVDPLNRGPVYFQGFPSVGGQGVVNINLVGPTASGHASLYVDLDDDPIGF